jgi:long-chain acyl-CoA synthetase
VLNVPVLLERLKAGIEAELARRGGAALALYRSGAAAWRRLHDGRGRAGDRLRAALAGGLVFRAIRRKIGPRLRALICGSAPLAPETQLYFRMLGFDVLQVYGLTETTAICTMDIPGAAVPGAVGVAIDGIEMRLGERDEILVRGPNLFAGYWNRPEATAEAVRDGWFHTGDRGEVDARGYWRILGRVKNLLVLASGHNVAPEPIEERLRQAIPGAEHVVVVGHGRPFLVALVSGRVAEADVRRAVEAANREAPHYRRVRAFHVLEEPLTVASGLLTANGKVRREAVVARHAAVIERLYREQAA